MNAPDLAPTSPAAAFLPLVWTVGPSADGIQPPKETVPAVVPGAVQLDWGRAHGYGPHWYADNWRDYGWMEDVHWTYCAVVPGTALPVDTTAHLVLRGVDYRFAVRINGETLHEQEGMFRGVEIDVTGLVRGGMRIEIAIWPAPKYEHAHRPKAQASRSCKPAVSYGWDFHPRLLPLGMWDEAKLELRPRHHIKQACISYDLAAGLRSATIRANVTCAQVGHDDQLWLRWVLAAPDGSRVFERRQRIGAASTEVTGQVDEVRLWWPSGEGEAALYSSEIFVEDESGNVKDKLTRRHGFRRVRLVMHEGAWNEPSTFPKGRSDPPMTLEINGRRIFARGANWVAPTIFPGLLDAAMYEPLLQLAKDAHFNLLRCWGGATVNKQCFFERCDELGLMVWQEFPLACNEYADDAHYLQVLDAESRAIISKLREHASVVLWCGGNELFNVWSGMTDQHLALRLLNRNCFDLDPRTPFLPTSPVGGVGHGDYRFRDDRGREVFQIFSEASNTAYTEFGCPGPASAQTLATFMPEEERWPPRPGTTWETHHAYGAWMVAPTSWLFQDLIEEYFGPCADLETLLERGQLLQAEGYKCLYEEARRQKPKSAMALCWCFNEPWPTAANNSLISWPARPKPAYHAVAASCRPTLASAKIPRFSWHAGDALTFELWLLNDAPAPVRAGTMHARVLVGGDTYHVLDWTFPEVAAGKNLCGPTVRFVLPEQEPGVFTIEVHVAERPELSSTYRLCHRKRLLQKPIFVLPGGDNNA